MNMNRPGGLHGCFDWSGELESSRQERHYGMLCVDTRYAGMSGQKSLEPGGNHANHCEQRVLSACPMVRKHKYNLPYNLPAEASNRR
jgi:hypothetical protein